MVRSHSQPAILTFFAPMRLQAMHPAAEFSGICCSLPGVQLAMAMAMAMHTLVPTASTVQNREPHQCLLHPTEQAGRLTVYPTIHTYRMGREIGCGHYVRTYEKVSTYVHGRRFHTVSTFDMPHLFSQPHVGTRLPHIISKIKVSAPVVQNQRHGRWTP